MSIPPTDGMIIGADTTLAPGVYHLPHGLTIAADGVTLDGGGALRRNLFRANRQDLECVGCDPPGWFDNLSA